jgi:hypothetical protein
MAILELHPKLGFSEDNQNYETPVKLGDGYLMAGRVKGSDRKSYSINGILNTEDEMTEVVEQFQELAGAVPFEWSPIPGAIAYRSFWCSSFDVSPIGADSQGHKWEVSAKFEESR